MVVVGNTVVVDVLAVCVVDVVVAVFVIAVVDYSVFVVDVYVNIFLSKKIFLLTYVQKYWPIIANC